MRTFGLWCGRVLTVGGWQDKRGRLIFRNIQIYVPPPSGPGGGSTATAAITTWQNGNYRLYFNHVSSSAGSGGSLGATGTAIGRSVALDGDSQQFFFSNQLRVVELRKKLNTEKAELEAKLSSNRTAIQKMASSRTARQRRTESFDVRVVNALKTLTDLPEMKGSGDLSYSALEMAVSQKVNQLEEAIASSRWPRVRAAREAAVIDRAGLGTCAYINRHHFLRDTILIEYR